MTNDEVCPKCGKEVKLTVIGEGGAPYCPDEYTCCWRSWEHEAIRQQRLEELE